MTTAANTIFITGAASGIGLAATRRFLLAGWNVGACDIDAAALEAQACTLPHVERLECSVIDTRQRAALAAAVARLTARWGGLDAVFANAGIHQTNTLLDIADDDLERIIAINIRGTINTLQACVPALRARGGGAIVLNASDQVLIGKRASFGYGLTKGAIGQMTRSLALDLGGFGIRVNAVCPGTIRTPLAAGAFQRYADAQLGGDTARAWRQEAAQYPIGRVGEPDDVAHLVYFLCTPEAGFITGSLQSIDGGLTAG